MLKILIHNEGDKFIFQFFLMFCVMVELVGNPFNYKRIWFYDIIT